MIGFTLFSTVDFWVIWKSKAKPQNYLITNYLTVKSVDVGGGANAVIAKSPVTERRDLSNSESVNAFPKPAP